MKREGGDRDLAASFRRLIRADGPIPVARFMGESNARYYATRDPLGAAKDCGGGDFVTAPEISQMFGELAGLWLADLWVRAGRPANAIYAELGPGRGTLARDALRAMQRAGLTPDAHLVEGSPVLRNVQAAALPEAQFHDDLASLPEDRPLLLVANEFLDALPVRQLVRTPGGWRERMVGLDGERFLFVSGDQPMDAVVPPGFEREPVGAILETCPAAAAIVEEITRRLARQGGAALLIDYGHLEPRTGSTLQAVRAHRKVDPLLTPGAADLTAHVDFAALRAIARRERLRVAAATQGEWLAAMGIDLRAAALARAVPASAEEIELAKNRLVSPAQMGMTFKVMGLVAPSWPHAAGFAHGEDMEQDAQNRD